MNTIKLILRNVSILISSHACVLHEDLKFSLCLPPILWCHCIVKIINSLHQCHAFAEPSRGLANKTNRGAFKLFTLPLTGLG